MDLTSIVERLNKGVPQARRVKFAMSLPVAREDVLKQSVGESWIYIIPGALSGLESDIATDGADEVAVDQLVAVEFEVWVFTKNVSQTLGAGANDKLWPIRKAYGERLLGWLPEGAEEPIQFARGAPQGFSDMVSVYRDVFRTATRYVSVATGYNT